MSYTARITPEAEEQIAGCPEPLRTFVRNCIGRIVRSPSTLPWAFRAAPRGQVAEFHFGQGGVSVWVTITFMYGQDEQTLFIEDVSAEFGP